MSVDCFAEKSGQNGSPMKCTISTQCFFVVFFSFRWLPMWTKYSHGRKFHTKKNGMMNKDAQAIRIRIRQVASIWNLRLFLAPVQNTFNTWCPTENSYSIFQTPTKNWRSTVWVNKHINDISRKKMRENLCSYILLGSHFEIATSCFHPPPIFQTNTLVHKTCSFSHCSTHF